MENSRIPGNIFLPPVIIQRCFIGTGPLYSPGRKRSSSYFIAGMNILVVYNISLMNWRCQILLLCWDARGHGKSSGPRGYSPSLARSVRDVDEFVRFAASDSQVGLEEVVVIAQSVGAVLVATWIHDYAPAIRGLVLASPAFKVKLYVPLARPALALWHRLRGLFFINSYVKGRYLTHDRQRGRVSIMIR